VEEARGLFPYGPKNLKGGRVGNKFCRVCKEKVGWFQCLVPVPGGSWFQVRLMMIMMTSEEIICSLKVFRSFTFLSRPPASSSSFYSSIRKGKRSNNTYWQITRPHVCQSWWLIWSSKKEKQQWLMSKSDWRTTTNNPQQHNNEFERCFPGRRHMFVGLLFASLASWGFRLVYLFWEKNRQMATPPQICG